MHISPLQQRFRGQTLQKLRYTESVKKVLLLQRLYLSGKVPNVFADVFRLHTCVLQYEVVVQHA